MSFPRFSCRSRLLLWTLGLAGNGVAHTSQAQQPEPAASISGAPKPSSTLATSAAGTSFTGVTTVTAFVDVTVIPMDSERTLPGQTVLVQGNKITALGPIGRVRIPSGAVRVDGRGKFLIPGLADMHTHVEISADSAVAERGLFLMVANGVTTIRDASYGAFLERMHGKDLLRLRTRAASGEIISPRIYTSAKWSTAGGLDSGSILEKVTAYKAAGYDFIKIHDEEAETYHALVAAAHEVGIPFAGHVPTASGIGLEEALRDGYHSIEHLTGYLPYLVRGDATPAEKLKVLMQAGSDSDFLNSMRQQLDTSKIPTIAVATQRAGVWNCPTQWMEEIVTSGARMDTLFWPEKPYLSEKVKDQERNLVSDGGPNERIVAGPRGTLEALRHIIKALQDAGAGLLSGTDVLFGIPTFVLPGFSLHHELNALVNAGLTPYQALVTSTRNVAVYFGTQNETGTIAPGKRADLVLLSANPVENIRNTTRIAGVVVNGRWFSREELDRRLASYVGGTP